ncbi:MAG: D-alanine--D-alanine ligase family protein, partial [Candidatus Saccharimonadales bacterium]
IGISKDGVWRQYDPEHFVDGAEGGVGLVKLVNTPLSGRLAVTQNSRAFYDIDNSGVKLFEVDIIFPAVLGNYAEDGTMQGLLRMMDVPFTTPDVLGSSVGMDKDVAYRLLRDDGLNVAPFITVRSHMEYPSFDSLVQSLGTSTIFVKPSNAGSSVGVSRVNSQDELITALNLAFKYDVKVIIQAGIIGREVEISITGLIGKFETSVVGEIRQVKEGDFYSYGNKYINSDQMSVLIAPAELPKGVAQTVGDAAKRVCEVLECEGFSRVDFFVDRNNVVYVNEINTMPGFTAISMFPRLWNETGVDYPTLVDRLLTLATERYEYRIAPIVLDAKDVLEMAKQAGAV